MAKRKTKAVALIRDMLYALEQAQRRLDSMDDEGDTGDGHSENYKQVVAAIEAAKKFLAK